MENPGLLDLFPLWTILPITIGVSLLSVELGYRFARYLQRDSQEEKEAPVGGMVGATLALLALMLAFTFGLAGSRFEDRRQVVLSEANAIGTAYLRAGLLPEPMRTETQLLFREYVDVRLDAAKPDKLSYAITKSEELQNRLWSQAVAASEKDRSPITGLFVQSLNEVIDLHAVRMLAALRSRVPAAIWIVLFLLSFLSMAMMGYHEALTNSKRSIAVLALILGFSSVLFLIVDLDRPRQGTLQVSQQAMVDLRNSMK
jgi:hypothetical protein